MFTHESDDDREPYDDLIEIELTDDEWLKKLELFSTLKGKQQHAFVDEALASRALASAHKRWQRAVKDVFRKANRRGPFLRLLEESTTVPPPESWIICPACNGAPPAGECLKCFGFGYRLE